MENEKYIRQHYVPKFILKNFSYNGFKTSLYNKEKDKLTKKDIKDVFMEKRYYENDEFGKDIEIRMGQTIEKEMSNIINNKILGNEEIIINRFELTTIKKFLLLQFIRNDFYKEKMDKGTAFLEDRKNNESIQDQWLRYINIVLNFEIGYLLQATDIPSPIKFLAKIIHKFTYLCFLETTGDIDFVLPDNGLVKEPAAYRSFYIMPLTPKLSILLVDTEIKRCLTNPRLSDIFEKRAFDYYMRDLVKEDFIYYLDDKSKEDLGRLNIPLYYLRPNENRYMNKYAKLVILNNDLCALKKDKHRFHKNALILRNRFREITNEHGEFTLRDLVVKETFFHAYKIGELIAKGESKAAYKHFLNKKKWMYDIDINFYISPFDLFYYPKNYVDSITVIYLNFMMMEESIESFVFKDLKMFMKSLFANEILGRRVLERPEYPLLMKLAKEEFPVEWEAFSEDVEFSKKMSKMYDYDKLFKTKIKIK